MNTNNPENNLNNCNDKFPQNVPNDDTAPPYCGRDDSENKRAINDDELNWLKENIDKEGLGAKIDSDPMKRGLLRNGFNDSDPNVLYRYTRSIQATCEALQDMFGDLIVIDDNGKAHPVPIIHATQERAVAIIMQDNVRKDETKVVDRIKLPMMAISATDFEYDVTRYTYHKALDFGRTQQNDWKPGFVTKEKRDRDTVFGKARGIPVNITYTLTAWTTYVEDMDQILEQILGKFSLGAYIRVRGINWEVIVELQGITNNIDTEPGDSVRIVKFQFNIVAKTYIPQPIRKEKAVLSTRIDLLDGLDESEIDAVISKLEEKVKETE